MRTYKDKVKKLEENQIFCFNSNLQGKHNKGAALVAKLKFGAKQKIAVGYQGSSYGIVTKDLTKKTHPSISKEYIKSQISTLYRAARSTAETEYMIAYLVGTQYNSGYTDREMAEMFNSFPIPDNIVFNEEFADLILDI